MEHPQKRVKKRNPRRERRLSRRALMLIAVGVLVAVAGALVLLLPAIKTRFPSELVTSMETTDTHKTLETGNVKVLDTIAVTHEDGESYTLLYRDEQLYLENDGGDVEIVNESYTDEIVEAATEIAVTDTVAEDAETVSNHLADMGLEPPEITVKVTYANGYEVELQLGAEVPGTTYHYYRWSGDEGVYMCDVGIYEAFEYTAHMLLPVEQPTLTPALIDHVSLDTQAHGLMECTFTADGTDVYLGALTAPYAYPMDSDMTTTLLTALENFRLGTKLGAVDASNRAQYGFDSPALVLDVHQQPGLYTQVDSDGVLQTLTSEEETVRITLGAQDGEYFYFCEYAGECYRVSSFLVATLVEADPDQYVTHAPADMGQSDIASVTVQLGDATLSVRAAYTERVQENNELETDTEGNVIYDVSVTANGTAITEDAFDSLVERLRQMTVSGTLAEPQTPSGTPRWQMTLTTTGGATRTLAAYPMDAFSDLLTVNGVAMHYLNSEALQIALGELYPDT